MSDFTFNEVLRNVDSFSYEEKISLIEALKKSVQKMKKSFFAERKLSKNDKKFFEALAGITGIVPETANLDDARTEAILKV